MEEKKSIKSVYEACQLLVRQAEAEAAKNEGKVSDSIINTLQEAFSKIIDFEKTFLITAQDKFYGSMLMNIETEIDITQRGPVDLKIDRPTPALSFNPLFCAKYTFPEFTGLVIGEILNLTYLHPTTFAELNSERDNGKHEDLLKASDAAISELLKHDIRLTGNSYSSGSSGLKLANDAYTTASLFSELGVRPNTNQSMEYYYKLLRNFKKKSNGGQGPNGPQTQIQMQGSGNSNNPNSGQDGQPNPNAPATRNNNNGHPTREWEAQSNKADDIKECIKSLVQQTYNSLTERDRGYMPGWLAEHINVLLAPPKINWKQILRKMVGAIPVPYTKTRTRLDRRQPERTDLPGRQPKRTVDIICAFDTSGSMSDKAIAYCMNEVFNIIKVYEGAKVTIVECDASIGKVYQAKNMSQVQTKVTGRGGTSFIPVIEYINGEKQYLNNPKYPNAGKFRHALLVYFTDGYGDYEIPKPKTFRNLWVIVGGNENCLSLKEPYGDVKALKDDEDYNRL